MGRVERVEPKPDPTHLSDVSTDVSDLVIQRVDSVDSAQCVLTQSRNTTALPKAVQSSFQVQIEPFSRQRIRDDQYYAPTTITFRFELRSSHR